MMQELCFRQARMSSSFKGNKQHLPSKTCSVCNRVMTWRKAWAKNWEQVKYCSEACRKAAPKKT